IGNGSGGFSSLANVGTGSEPKSIVVVDLDGDGKLDMVTANQMLGAPGTVSTMRGNGNGTFQTKIDTPASDTVGTHEITSGDFNNDGHPDVAVAGWGSNKITVLLGTGAGTGSGVFQTP